MGLDMDYLQKIKKPKRDFDVKSQIDVALYKNFLVTNAWGVLGCPFALEFPYLTVPDMIKDKLIHHFLGVVK
jgi:hypothetical protein